MRVIWSTLTEPGVQRKNAFSLDATCEELLFVAGPVIAIALIGVGLVLGVMEVFAPAHAAANNAVEMSGWLLAAFAAGSAIGGVAYGALPMRSTLTSRLTVLIIGLSVTVALIPLAPTLLVTSIGLFIAGLSLAPTLITGYLIADETVPSSAQTEASAWINTVINLGASIGAGVAGIVIDGYSAEALLWATAVLTLAGVAVLPRRAVAAAAESDVPEIIPGTEDGPQCVERA